MSITDVIYELGNVAKRNEVQIGMAFDASGYLTLVISKDSKAIQKRFHLEVVPSEDIFKEILESLISLVEDAINKVETESQK